MKEKKLTITLLGNNSGRNLGDATILSSILDAFSKKAPKTEFLVPSISPEFIDDNYGKEYKVKGVNVLPWTGSIRLFGIPTIISLFKSDAALICDGIIFGRKLFSPHNFLITLVGLLPFIKLSGCKLMCFSTGIGPFPSKLSEVFARWVIQACDLIIMREEDSQELTKKIGVTKPVLLAGDSAFMNPISKDEKALEIFKIEGIDPNAPLLGLNITPYYDSWLTKEERFESQKAFVDAYVAGVKKAEDELQQQFGGKKLEKVFFCCSPMDEELTKEVAKKTGAKMIDNTRFLSHDIQACMRRCDIVVGMRFHSCVLALSAQAPVIALVYAPKVKSHMRLLRTPEFAFELKDLTADSFSKAIVSAWAQKAEILAKQQPVVEELRRTAFGAVDQVLSVFGLEPEKVELPKHAPIAHEGLSIAQNA